MSDFFEQLEPESKPPAQQPPTGAPPASQGGAQGGTQGGAGWIPGFNPSSVPVVPQNPGIRGGGAVPRPPMSGVQNAPMPGSPDKRRVDGAVQQAQSWIRNNRPREAYNILRQVLGAQPHNAEANHLMSWLLLSGGQWDLAMATAQRAVASAPGNPKFHLGVGMVHMARGEHEPAIKAMEKTLRLDTNNVPAMLNLVRLCFLTEDFRKALASAERAMKLVPGRPEPYANRGMVRVQIGEPDEGLADVEKAIAIDPSVKVYHENAAYVTQYCEQIDKERVFAIHKRTGAAFEAAAGPVQAWMVDRDPDRPLRVGFVTRDLCRHSCAYFAEPLFEHLDRERVQPIAYYTNKSSDEVTERFKAHAHEWHDVHQMSAQAMCAKIRQDKIDVLIELAGYTTGNRMDVFAAKPAPVQVAYLGYPDTTGLTRIDYRLVDAHTDPEGETLATEELFRLPRSFLCYKPHDMAPVPGTRDHDAPITFGSFNDFKKMNPGTYDLWAGVLNAVPGSRLLVKSKSYNDPWIRERSMKEFTDRGIDKGRVEIIGRLEDPADHLRLYDRVDIGLETMPYHGTTTTCEAMWMGVPVVSLAGDRHRSRVGVSLLSAVGLEELIAGSDEDYVKVCAELAGDRGRLAELRGTMRDRLRESPLLDAEGFCRDFEGALRTMWQRWCASDTGVDAGAGRA